MAVASSKYQPAIGSLVNVRQRDWVVVGTDGPEVLLLRPLTGSSAITGIYLPLEPVKPARFEAPDPSVTGDATGAMLLFDAARLAIRNGAAPFRLLAHVSVDPRAYQFVPLIMALRQNNVRLMIADDVGVGKTIEAGMIARELLDRGLAARTAVVCPAHLTQQWAKELNDKFGINAKVVQPSTIGRLNRELPRPDLSLYRHYPHIVVSVDWIKSDTNAPQFLRDAPDLVIVDEAHMCARPPGQTGKSQHQRFDFVSRLAKQTRHLILVTATPHSGIDSSFRSLIGLLEPELDSPNSEDDSGQYSLLADVNLRDRLRKFIVLRRRDDLAHWLDQDTPFPQRRLEAVNYRQSEEYIRLYDDVVRYCRESIAGGASLGKRQQRVRFWAAAAILRCVLSSPMAAQSVLQGRAIRRGGEEPVELDSGEEADSIFRPQVLDPIEEGDASDFTPSAPVEEADAQLNETERQRLMTLGRRAAQLAGPTHDVKLAEVARLVFEMLRDKSSPIVFCRYIATAKYLEDELPKLLAQKGMRQVRVKAVTGEIGDDERRQRVEELGMEPIRVLVATDCLSGGINLQEHFNAVIHYDLPWNPNRLEQRDGRVDRYGQPHAEVRAVRMVGIGTAIDEIVNTKLLEKSIAIRRQLGVTVPVPGDATSIAEAIVDTVLLAGSGARGQATLEMTDPALEELDADLEAAAEREEQIRSFFATPIQPDEVKEQIAVTRSVLGDPASIQRFTSEGIRRFGGGLKPAKVAGTFELSGGDLKTALAYRNCPEPALITFEAILGAEGRATFAGRTHPAIETLADTILGRSLAEQVDAAFPRCGAIYTTAVERRTAILLLRLRYLMRDEAEEYAEEVVLQAIQEQSDELMILDDVETYSIRPTASATATPFALATNTAESLLANASPVANMSREEKSRHAQWAIDLLNTHENWYEPVIGARVKQLEFANNRLRAMVSGGELRIEPHTPPDLMGFCVLVPAS